MTQEQKGTVRADQIEVLTEHFITAGFPPVPARRVDAEERG
ncbi:hypothetical protein [Gluconobacter albidus]|nr:hypothetical protein [Gluconobacter albidus]